jgi:endoglucanase
MNILVPLGAVGYLLASLPAADSSQAGVPRSRLERLSRGTNVTQWFQVYGQATEDHYRSYMSDEEITLIRRLGLRHVRLCISPQYLYDPTQPDQPLPSHVAALEEAIRRLNAHDLAVIVDPHNTNQKRIEDDRRWSDGYPTFWGALAARLRHFNPEMLFFEVVNEPVFDRREAEWFALQERIVAAIRKNAPEHTIIATGPNWGGVDGLRKLTPLSDRNIVYSFHFYDPFTFTHQGATWAGRVPPLLKDIPYPSSPEAVADALSRSTDPEARGWVEGYGRQRWNRERLKNRLAEALAWGKEHAVPLYCGEFGVYPLVAPPDSRRRWFRDFASVLKESGVGYSVWGWDDGFGFGRRYKDGKPVIDPVPVEALGLHN